MENRHRILLGLEPDVFRSTTSDSGTCLTLLEKARACWGFTPTTLRADKGFFAAAFIEAVLDREIEPHITVDRAVASPLMRASGCGCEASATSCRSGAGRRSRSCSVKARTGVASDASEAVGCTASARRRT
jgi:hypothetical protein